MHFPLFSNQWILWLFRVNLVQYSWKCTYFFKFRFLYLGGKTYYKVLNCVKFLLLIFEDSSHSFLNGSTNYHLHLCKGSILSNDKAHDMLRIWTWSQKYKVLYFISLLFFIQLLNINFRNQFLTFQYFPKSRKVIGNFIHFFYFFNFASI